MFEGSRPIILFHVQYKVECLPEKETIMKETRLSIPEIALIAGTRAALGAGAALLLGDLLTNEQKKAVGWTLVMVGVVTTVPLLANVIGKRVQE
jgi:EamA domain-containing membrane protein RarD